MPMRKWIQDQYGLGWRAWVTLAADFNCTECLMCRNIKTLFNFEPPATEEEVEAAARQYVRKISGFTRPSQINEAAFEAAVDDIALRTRQLLDQLTTRASARNRDQVAAQARLRGAKRFGRT